MKKIHLFGVMLVAMLAFGAVSVTQALALETVWLEGGVVPAEMLLVDSEGELLLQDLSQHTGILCSGLNEGWIGGDASNKKDALYDEITKITNLAGTSNRIVCSFDEGELGSCEASSAPEAEAVHLPWLTELLLVTEGGVTKVLDDITGTGGGAGWSSLCLVLGINIVDTCTAELAASADIDNTAEGDVLALFSTEISPEPALCSITNEKVGDVTGEVLILAASGESLAWSEAEDNGP